MSKRFLYHANAFALGGTIRKVIGKDPREPLKVQAATVLPPAGGNGVSEAGCFRYRDLHDLSFCYGAAGTDDGFLLHGDRFNAMLNN